jgi:hypothetical protein
MVRVFLPFGSLFSSPGKEYNMNYQAYIANLYEALDQGNINGARGTFDQIFASVEKVLKGYLARRHGSNWLETNGMDIV